MEFQTFPYQLVKVAREEVGEEERGDVLVGLGGKRLVAGKEGIAVRPLNALHALFLKHGVQEPSRAAVAVEQKDALESVPAGAMDAGANGIGNLAREVMEFGRQAGELKLPAPVVALNKIEHFACQCAARD